MALKMFLAVIISIFFGIMLQIPKKTILPVGFAGMLGWLTNFLLVQGGSSDVLGAFLGALVVSIMAEILARIQLVPITVYVVAGIIPLVPGTTAYTAMLHFVNGQYAEGLNYSLAAAFMASAIAVGIAFISLVSKHFKRT